MGFLARLFGGAGRAPTAPAYPTPTTQLPVVETVRARGFCFGLPWPWEQAPGEAVQSAEGPPIVAVTALRTDGRDPLFCVSERGAWGDAGGRDLRDWLDEFARANSARPTGIRKVALGGSPAHVLQASRGNERLALLVAPSRGRLLEGFLRVPAPGYLHHFEVMLATWRWTR